MNKLAINFIVYLFILALPVTSHTQPQQVEESPQVLQLDSRQSKSLQNRPGDLRKFFEMENPRAAAKALREHAQKYGISLETQQQAQKAQLGPDEQPKTTFDNSKKLIHVFNDKEFTPTAGIEEELSEKASRLIKDSKVDEKLVCIIQIKREMTIGDIIELLEMGVRVYEPLGRSSIIARITASSIESLQNRSYIRWIGKYKTEYKYSSTPSNSKKPGAFIYPLGGDNPEYRVDLAQMGIIIRGYDTIAHFYDVILDVSSFQEVAENLWWVKGILKEPEEILETMTDVTVNFEPNDSRELIMAYNTSYTGNSVLVGVRDNAVYETHPELSGIFNSDSELGGNELHGTHVTGIIAGRSKTISGPWGNSTVKGVAPGTTILFRQTDWSWVPNSYYFDFQSFQNNSVQISNHSYTFLDWGSPDYSYDGNTENFDAYSDNSDMVIIKSAGNQYNPSTITNPGTAKNVVAVGAIQYVTNGTDVIGERASYSSQGPTADDGRMKPELVAPGGDGSWSEGVVSTNSNPWDAGSGYSGNINGNYEWPEWQSDDNYIRLSGTSMAAPHVTGVCAKIKDWSPTLHSEPFKALLINTTIPIKDNSDNSLGAYANTQVGYGMVNAFSVTSYYTGESSRLLFGEDWIDEDDNPLYHDWTITVPSGSDKLIVTMAYNDQEGEESNSDALIDDLDLILISPGGSYYYAYSYIPSNINTESPLEKIVITNPSSGQWTVRVRFTDSPGFNNLFIYAQQRYGVVAHAILKTPELTLNIAQPTINVNPGESFNIQPTISNTGGYIIAGVTAKVDGSIAFGGDINKSKYVGNLMYQNASVSPQITLTAPSSPGTYTLTVKADGINKEFDNSSYPKTTQITVNVQPPAPTLVSPSNGSVVSTSTPLFDWSDTPGQTNFRAVVYDNVLVREEDIVINHTELSSASQWLCDPPLSDGTYWWKVNVSTGGPAGSYSSVWSFTVQTAPTLVSPSNGSVVSTSTPLFDWSDTPGQTNFRVVVYNNELVLEEDIVINHPELSSASQWLCDTPLSDGTYWWKVNVSTGGPAGSYSSVWSFTVNAAPVVSDIPDQTITEGNSFTTISLDSYVSDVDNTDSEMTWTYSGNNELSVTINSNRVATIGIPNADWNDSETITFRATDPGEMYDSDPATFTVTPVDDAPTVANAISDVNVDEDAANTTIDLSNVFTDVDNDDASITKSVHSNTNSSLVSATIDGNTLTLDYQYNQSGTSTITIRATSNSKTVDDEFTITVNAVDDAPTVANTISDVSVDEDAANTAINLSNVFTDVDNDDSSITKSVHTNTNPSLVSATIDGNTLTLDYQDNQSGTAAITIRATSNSKTVDDEFTVTVNAVDDAPTVANAISDVSVDEDADNTSIDLSNVFTDADNDDASISKSVQSNTNPSLVSATVDGNTLTLDYQDDQSGTATITIRATSNSKTVDDEFTVTVNEINDPPVISGFPDTLSFRADSTVVLDLNEYVDDIDDPDLELSWSVTGNDSVMVFINLSTNIVELSASLTFSGEEHLVFTVEDDSLASDTDTVVVIVLPHIKTVAISLNAGWNLISWDVDTPNDSILVLLSDIMYCVIRVLGFEEGGLTYDPDWPQFSNLQLMDHLHGYWIKVCEYTTLYITGVIVPDDTPIEMEAGWNVVSYLPDYPDSITHALGSVWSNVEIVLGFDAGGLTYDPDWPQFSNLQIMYSTYGYWIRVTESCTLIYPDTQVVSGTAMAKVSASGSFESEVTPTNEWINVLGDKVLFDGELLKIGIMVQAKDPDGIICGEYIINREGCFGMMPVYRDDPTTEVDEGADVEDKIKIYLDGIEVDETITWGTFGEVYQVGLTPLNKALTMSYGLSQNFPNPFNPVTQIKYHLPESGQVTLTIFNVLGQRVRILVDGLNEAGYYTVYWDGRDDRSKKVTSGVYFYRINAGRFSKTRKMIILR